MNKISLSLYLPDNIQNTFTLEQTAKSTPVTYNLCCCHGLLSDGVTSNITVSSHLSKCSVSIQVLVPDGKIHRTEKLQINFQNTLFIHSNLLFFY